MVQAVLHGAWLGSSGSPHSQAMVPGQEWPGEAKLKVADHAKADSTRVGGSSQGQNLAVRPKVPWWPCWMPRAGWLLPLFSLLASTGVAQPLSKAFPAAYPLWSRNTCHPRKGLTCAQAPILPRPTKTRRVPCRPSCSHFTGPVITLHRAGAHSQK